MAVTRRKFLQGSSLSLATLLAACGSQQGGDAATDTTATDEPTQASSLALDAAAWEYDADDDVYYQLGLVYCENPADDSYEQLAILVPGAYFSATENGDGTYTCEVNDAGTVGAYTAATAPIVLPVNTPGYSAQAPMDAYYSQASYTDAGIVYVHAGCRGRDAGAPAGVVDLKAAVRFLRQVANGMPGNTERIFTFGMSGGGAQSALMGATGDAQQYEPYLEAIGAASDMSDAVYGSMDWCPITGLDVADEAYEWMMGCTREGLSEDEQAISDGLAEKFAEWLNGAGIVDANGATLELVASDSGIYQAGSYYELVRSTIEESLNNFLSDTEFPYDASASGGMGNFGGGMGPGGGMPQGGPNGEMPDGGPNGEFDGGPNGEFDGEMPQGGPDGEMPEDMGQGGNNRRQGGPGKRGPNGGGPNGTAGGAPNGDMANAEQLDDISRTETSGGVSLSGTYDTAADYIAALNANGEWVSYDEATNTATIASVEAFCVALKQASKSLGAFDQLDRGQGENTLFGENGDPSHFDALMADVLEALGSDYASDYADDLQKTDGLGTGVAARVSMYTPLFYLLQSEEGYGQSDPAKHWRIRTGINQGDTALTTELNLALALEADARVESVDFATVWGQGHTQAERSGSADENFIAWVADCMAQ